MTSVAPAIPQFNNGGNNFYDSLKGTLMSMFVYKGMSGKQGSSDAYMMVYIFIITNIIETVMKYLPLLVENYIKPHTANIETLIKPTNEETIKPNEAPRTKTSSITYNVNLAEQDNIIGQSVIDYVTNCKNTKHVSFIKKNYILNQKDIIEIDDDYYAKQTIDTSAANATTDQAGSTAIIQTVEVFSFTKNMNELRNFIQTITERYIANKNNQLGNRRYYFNVFPIQNNDNSKQIKSENMPPFMAFTMKEFKTNRKFSNLFGEHIDAIRKRVHFFINNKKWYDEKGIPYTLGLLLAGNPGTGKTSCIKCLANETDRHIININLNTQITKKQLENLFFNEEILVYNQTTFRNDQFKIPFNKRVYVFEDIDCQNNTLYQRNNESPILPPEPKEQNQNQNKNFNIETNPKNENKTNSDIDLSFLLNLFDGVLETPGRIIIMTSNFYKKLDRALIRPGRIDIISEFEDCSHSTIKQMFEFFYSLKLTEEQETQILSIPDKLITPAEMSKILFENFDSIEDGIKQLICVSSQIMESKKPIENKVIEVEVAVEAEAKIQPSENKVDTPVYTSKNELLNSLHNKNDKIYRCTVPDMSNNEAKIQSSENKVDTHPQQSLFSLANPHQSLARANPQQSLDVGSLSNDYDYSPSALLYNGQDYSEIANGNNSINDFKPYTNSFAPLSSYA